MLLRQGATHWDGTTGQMTLSVWRGLRLQGGVAANGSYTFSPVLVLPEDDGHAVLTVNASAQERSARLLGGTGRVVHEDAGAIGAPLAGPAQGWPLDGLHGSERDARNGLVHRGTRHYREVDGLWLQPEPLLVLGVPDGSLGTPRLLMGAYAAGNVNVWHDSDGYIPLETAWDVANVAMGVASFASNVQAGSYGAAVVDAVGVVADVAATVTPYAPGGAGTAIKLARGADAASTVLSTANKVDGAVDAGKAAGAAADASKAVNGNARASAKAQHGYEIIDTVDGTVAKTGVSGGKRTVDGGSYRANAQANKWNKEPGNAGRYEPSVVKEVPEGPGARGEILDWEKGNAERLREAGELDPARHVKP